MKEPKVARFGKYDVCYRHQADFDRIYTEVFAYGNYQFKAHREAPFIIDGGSHIGGAILLFKSRFPEARIIGFEPDPENWELLQLNLERNKIENVQVVNKALADKEGKATLYREQVGNDPSTWGNSIIHNMWGDADEQNPCDIETTRLGQYIDDQVDFLKLDIEGCEEQVLRDIESKLSKISQIELEYHGTSTSRDVNSLDRIVELLSKNSFLVDVTANDVKVICREQTIERVNPTFAQIKARRLERFI